MYYRRDYLNDYFYPLAAIALVVGLSATDYPADILQSLPALSVESSAFLSKVAHVLVFAFVGWALSSTPLSPGYLLWLVVLVACSSEAAQLLAQDRTFAFADIGLNILAGVSTSMYLVAGRAWELAQILRGKCEYLREMLANERRMSKRPWTHEVKSKPFNVGITPGQYAKLTRSQVPGSLRTLPGDQPALSPLDIDEINRRR